MTTPRRRARTLVAALTLAFLVSGARAFPRAASTECERNTSWSIWNVHDDRQTSDTVNGRTTETQDISDRTEVHSSRGEDLSLNTTHHTNADGSVHEHQEGHYSDSTGEGCGNDGVPRKGDNWSDTDVDAEGNRKEHWEDIIEVNGKCEKIVTDKEWDSKGKLIKDVESKTEVPCSKWMLEFSREASLSIGGITIQWGPNTAKVYMGRSGDGTYKGSFESVFDAKVTGKCVGDYAYPVHLDVSAEEDEFEDLDFTVTTTMSMSGTLSCAPGSLGNAPVTFVRTFTLAAQDGATKVYDIPMPGGQTTDTYTLKAR